MATTVASTVRHLRRSVPVHSMNKSDVASDTADAAPLMTGGREATTPAESRTTG